MFLTTIEPLTSLCSRQEPPTQACQSVSRWVLGFSVETEAFTPQETCPGLGAGPAPGRSLGAGAGMPTHSASTLSTFLW